MVNRARTIQVGVTAALLATFNAPARADLAWSVDTGASHTDNATLTDKGGPDDTLASVGGTIDYQLEGRRVQASLSGHGTYAHYIDNTFDDDFRSYLRGSLVVGIVPDRFLWTFNDTFGQIAVNQFDPVTPQNNQNLNTFETGPDVFLYVNTQSDVKLSARYGSSTYQTTDQIDTERLQGSIAFERHVSDTTSWSLVASDSHIKYDTPGDPSYDQPELYGSWQSREGRQTISLDVGANRIESDSGNFTKPLVRASWDRRIAPSWTVGAHLRSEYQNTAQQFANQNLLRNSDTLQLGISDAPAATYEGGVSLAFQRPRTRFNVEAGYTRVDYVVDNGLNEKKPYGGLNISRRHTPELESFLSYWVEKHRYEQNSDRDDTRQRVQLGLDWRVGRNVFLTGGYQHTNADSDSALDRYTVNLFFVTVSYRQGASTGDRGFAPY